MRALDQAIDLAAAFEASTNPYMLLTPDLRYAGMNAAYLAVVGKTRDELIGKPLFDIFTGGDTEEGAENARQLRASFDKVLATGARDHLALIHFAIPVTDADGRTTLEDRYWSATHTPLHDADGRIVLILQHTSDITELERLRRERDDSPAISALDMILGGGVMNRARAVQEDNRRLEIERNRLVEMFMSAPGFVAILSGPDHVFQMHNEAYARIIGRSDVVGLSIREALPDLAGQGYYELLDSVFATGEPYEGKGALVTFRPEGSNQEISRNVDFIYQPIRDNGGAVVGIFVQGHDVTDTVRAAQRQRLMIDELNHRVKNTLATVQSIAMQTARSHTDPRSFAESFQARLLSLSHTHDLLTRSHWEGADLRAVLEHETAAHGPSRIVLNGPPLPLGPAAALSLGMIFHELATNAAKYGALSTPDGRVFVDWSIADQTNRTLTMTWREVGGPTVSPPNRKGFGSRLIERNVRHDLAGEAKLSYASDGFIAELSVPLDRDSQQHG
ncbi:HWE histidine kinase domain-containing protein [Brevundimonas sp. NIBR11]|uniref:HWE histidine kinase domain-containing protein n=1 Tax=Brevundimonas sp. NIBR11 TaxID=3015999 RepID=UPI0022F0CA8B|nr:HWE histidine kinase domain-containing protein [Brevundimonas sp. NIBR11]WGM30764.1 Blue-light-activated histidine kinase [Brevundimonas sp. NIBR11]